MKQDNVYALLQIVTLLGDNHVVGWAEIKCIWLRICM